MVGGFAFVQAPGSVPRLRRRARARARAFTGCRIPDLQSATQTGTLLDNGQRPGRLRRHIELGLAVAQQLLGQKNTQHRTRDEFQGRHDTAGGQVCGHNWTRTGCLFCMPQHMCPSLPDPFAAQCARRTFPAV